VKFTTNVCSQKKIKFEDRIISSNVSNTRFVLRYLPLIKSLLTDALLTDALLNINGFISFFLLKSWCLFFYCWNSFVCPVLLHFNCFAIPIE